MNRRDFLLSMGAIALSPTVSIANSFKEKQQKSIIYVFLSGGISATEFINPIPEAPAEFRSVRGSVMSKGGYLLSGDFTKLASIGDHLTVVRNFHHRDGNHQSAQMWTNTGEPNFGSNQQKEPSYGSLLSYQEGPIDLIRGIPNYIQTRSMDGDGPAWLGSKFIGMKADENGVGNLFPRISRDRFDDRIAMMNIVSEQSGLKSPVSDGWKDLKNQAADIIRGKAGEAFDLTKEDPKVVELYNANRSTFGKDLLLSRRLIEAGAKFVTVNNGGWDHHTDINGGFDRRATELDASLFILLNDLKERGLLNDTLVVITSEFSRTPKINANSGRDHWPNVNSLMMAGGGFNHGGVIGKTDDNATVVDGDSFDPADLKWTLLSYLDFNKDLVITNNLGRPIHIFETEAKNILDFA